MPVCPQCENRQFTNKEALLQHMRSSSAYHPFCTPCDRRFTSMQAHEAHMIAKHPPTFDCTVCDRTFHAPFALEDHYRGSNAHPNCTKCGRGFRDLGACDEHRRTAHPKTACASCGGKVIYDDELANHFWDSPNHPNCTSCKTGFKDHASYVEHFSTAHPEQHCAVCTANFDTAEALQAHFWASPAHPKCDLCNIGLANDEARDLHLETVHIPTPTVIAASTFVEEEEPVGGDGVVGVIVEGNTELVPSTADASFDLPPAPSLPAPIQKTEPLTSSNSIYHTGFTPLSPRNPMQSLIVGERRINSPDLRLEHGFSPILDAKPPFSPTSLPRPGMKIEQFWSSTENVQIPAMRVNHFQGRTNEPYNASRLGYYVQPSAGTSSPTGSSSSSWFEPSRSAIRPQEKSFQPGAGSSSPISSSSTWFDPSRSTIRPQENPRLISSPPRLVSPPRERLSSPPRSEFHPRLYPGSVRAASLRQSLVPLNDARSGNENVAGPRAFANGSGAASVSGGTAYSYAQSHTSQSPPQSYSWHSSYAPSNYGGSVTGRSRGTPSETVNWEELMGPAPASPETIFSGPRNDSRATLFSETLSTPKTEVPSPTWSASASLFQGNLNLGAGSHSQSRLTQKGHQNAATSPSLATVSSPASGSSALGHSPVGSGGSAQYETETRPTTASSTPSYTTPLHALVCTITPSSECPSPNVNGSPLRSPGSESNFNLSFTLNSPAGLRPLPSMSPIPATPLDITEYDIPEARQPLPESPTEGLSPVTVVVELRQPAEETVDIVQEESVHPEPIEVQVPRYSTSPLSTSSAQSFITSPQEPAEADGPVEGHASPIPSPRPSPPLQLSANRGLDVDTDVTATSFLSDEMDMTTSTPVDNVASQDYTLTTSLSTPVTPIAFGGPGSDADEVELKGSAKAEADTSLKQNPNPNPLHCRVCLADSCDDITASMCGHIFCNRCITDAVIKTSRCPVCMTPTLLYCLFRLDLAA